MPITLNGIKFKKIIFDNGSDYRIAVFKVKDKEKIPKGYANNFYGDDYITVTGFFPCNSSISLDITGEWKKNKKFGYQFECFSCYEQIEETESGIIAYLSSGFIKGIGEAMAKRIVKMFGTDAVKVIEETPEKLLEVRGISEKKLKKIISSYEENAGIRDVSKYLAPFGISNAKCARIYQKFKGNSIAILQENPYLLEKVSGFGFKTIDSIARKTNIALDDPLRVKAAIKFLLNESKMNGHLCLEQKDLLRKANTLLNEDFEKAVCPQKVILETFVGMAKEGELKGDRGYAYLPNDYDEENIIAKKVVYRITRNEKQKFSNLKILTALQLLEKCENITLAEKQREAVIMAMNENFSIITGGPGVGKTTVLKFILKTWEILTHNNNILLLAPTGRAARRMGESVENKYPSSTIHSALGLIGGEEEINEPKKINRKIVVIDEASMCDSNIFYNLLCSLNNDCKLIILGDPQQLPSVGAGNVLFELLKNEYVPRTKLDVVYRQGQESLIVKNSQAIEEGKTELSYGNDFEFISRLDVEDIADCVCSTFMKEYEQKGNDLNKVQILSPFRKAGVKASSTEINKKIQSLINPPARGKREVVRHNTLFRVGDKVIQTKNTENVSNGDMGIIKSISVDEDVEIEFQSGTYIYDLTELDDVDLAYAISIHKFQGSECDTIIIPVCMAFYIMLKRNLIYTGITRGKNKVILIGEKKALAISIKNNDISKRNTFLSDRIIEMYLKTTGMSPVV